MNITCTASPETPDNSTEDPYTTQEAIRIYELSHTISKIFSPIILVTGTFGNVMSIIIMSRMRSRDSTIDILFTAIAVGDLMVLYTGHLTDWMQAVFAITLEDHWPDLSHAITWICWSAACTVAYLLVCVTLQRAASVVWLHKVNRMFTTQRVKHTIAGISVFWTLFYSHFIFGDYVTSPMTTPKQNCPSSKPYSVYDWFVDDVFAYMDLVVFSIVPFILLSMGNSFLAYKLLVTVRETRKTVIAADTQQVLKRQRETKSVTLTALMVSSAYIILTLPSCMYNVLFNIRQTSTNSEDKANEYLMYIITYLLANTNSAINFYLYCLTGRRFRQEFVKIICCRKTAEGSKMPSVSSIT